MCFLRRKIYLYLVWYYPTFWIQMGLPSKTIHRIDWQIYWLHTLGQKILHKIYFHYTITFSLKLRWIVCNHHFLVSCTLFEAEIVTVKPLVNCWISDIGLITSCAPLTISKRTETFVLNWTSYRSEFRSADDTLKYVIWA